MNTDPQTRMTASWRTLQDDLTGSFTARARDLPGNEFILSGKEGGVQGRLKMLGTRGAEFRIGDLEATLERLDSSYTMLFGGKEVLSARASGGADKLEIWCEEKDYTATISLFRNRAVARDEAGVEVMRLVGNVTGRAYEVEMVVEEPCASPLAVLLIYHTASHRRRAYRAAFRG